MDQQGHTMIHAFLMSPFFPLMLGASLGAIFCWVMDLLLNRPPK
jgi:hypothetical protein